MRAAARRLTRTLRIACRSASLAGMLAALAMVKPCAAQNDSTNPASESSDYPGPAQPDISLTDYLQQEPEAPPAQEDFPEQPSPVLQLDTGEPLMVLLTPLHWGRFSFLSVTAYEGYSSNPSFQKIPVGANITSISTLALYSTQFAGWKMNLQYQPFVWISSTRTVKDFAAASADLQTLRHINDSWHWTLGERLRYSPTHSSELTKGIVANPGGGFTIGDAFLSSGRNILVNGIATTLTDRYSQNSTLIFHANQDYTRLSGYVGSQSIDNIPTQQAVTFSTGAIWRDHLGLKDTLSTEYTYRLQASTGTSAETVGSHAASVGLSHKFTRRFGTSVSGGPAWSIYPGHNGSNGRARITAHGSFALSEEFKGGGVVLAFARSNDFSGIISDGFHNRYDLTVHREFNARWSCSATMSYVQQQITNQRSTQGELGSAEIRHFFSRNWAAFAQVRYLDLTGSQRFVAPEKNAVAGIRWSWVPEKP
jgi:hypothetical protein